MAVVTIESDVVEIEGDPVTTYGAPDFITAPSFSSPEVGTEITPTAATWYDGTHNSYSWEQADDAIGTGATEVATTEAYTPDTAGKYLRHTQINARDGQTTDAQTGWIGPVAAGGGGGNPSACTVQPLLLLTT